MLFKLAWRNIWRNKRRTYITAASVLFAVLFASFMESLQKGAWRHMISNVVNYYYGYVQVHRTGYWEEQSIDKAFEYKPSLATLAEGVSEVENVLPRLESFALAAAGDQTKGVLLVGIDPEREDAMTDLKERLQTGHYFEDAAEEALIVAEGVAAYLNLGLGDTLVLISQGYHGVNAAGKYPIKGILSFGSPQLNQQMIYLPLKTAQWFYGADDLITSLALHIENPKDIPSVVRQMKTLLPADLYEVLDWKELLPELVQAQSLDSAGNVIVYFILYSIIAFGIFGTILMMTKERSYEFGVLTAIGMQRMKLAFTVWIEIIILGLIGAIAGILVSLPIIGYFKIHPLRMQGDFAVTLEKFGFEPIFPAVMDAQIFLYQALIVFVITGVLAFYPLWRVSRLEPVEAMRN